MTIFESIFTTFEESVIFEAAGEVVKISASLRITNFNQLKFVQIRDTHCKYYFKSRNHWHKNEHLAERLRWVKKLFHPFSTFLI